MLGGFFVEETFSWPIVPDPTRRDTQGDDGQGSVKTRRRRPRYMALAATAQRLRCPSASCSKGIRPKMGMEEFENSYHQPGECLG